MPMTPPAAEPASPCIGVCQLDAARVCLGCGRAIDEIAAWPLASPEQRENIRREAARRLSIIRPSPPAPPP
ncbi:MAG TPA: DUF1289 domain-containing protein [Nevskiaceae bacterium]|nr:DUF1289 domain-containing protein [Nevskiaceae bacterium]